MYRISFPVTFYLIPAACLSVHCAADGNKTKQSHFVFEIGKLMHKDMSVKPTDRCKCCMHDFGLLSIYTVWSCRCGQVESEIGS